MIPRLYRANETEFTSLGLGELSDAISCKVTEERNGSYELELEYPETGVLFSQIQKNMFILAKPNDTSNAQPFRIYSISMPISGTITVNAEHISYMLNGIPVSPFTATGIEDVLTKLKNNSLVDNPFSFSTDISNQSSSFSVTYPKSVRACLGGTYGSILDAFGGEFEWDRWTVKAHLHRGSDNGVTIDYGKNLTDLKQEESIEETYTGCLAYWKPSQNGETVTGAVQYVENHASYPHERIFILDESSDFQSAPTADELNAKAAAYITNNSLGVPKVNLKVSFIPLWQTEEYKDIAPLERVSLCDTVHINYSKLGITASAKVIKTEYDVLMERYNSIELGDAKSSMADTIKQAVGITDTVSSMIKKSGSFMQSAISTATKLIQGGLGGHVVINTNADGQPNEILIMDTDSISTAVNVIRINKNGIGFSTSGYNGPFSTAWTIDGKFTADNITGGSLHAGTIDGIAINGSVLTFGDSPNTVQLRTNDDKDGGIIDGSGVIEFNTKGMFNAVNKNSALSHDGSIIRMANDTVHDGRNYINLMNYNLLKADDSEGAYYSSLANSVYITANSAKANGNTMRFQNYVEPTSADTVSASTANQLLLSSVNNGATNSIQMVNKNNANTEKNSIFLTSHTDDSDPKNNYSNITLSNYDSNANTAANMIKMASENGSNSLTITNYLSGSAKSKIEMRSDGYIGIQSSRFYISVDQLDIYINGIGYTGLTFVNDGNGHSVLGKG